jgi:CheY-like chemotaxis protein
MTEEQSNVTRAKILFVEDEEAFAESISKILQTHGFEVELAFSGKQALEIYERGRFDLVITDLKMPAMDGIDFIRELKRIDPYQKIVVVTGFPGQLTPWNRKLAESREDILLFGSLDFLVKPFPPQRLIRTVTQVLEGTEPTGEKAP